MARWCARHGAHGDAWPTRARRRRSWRRCAQELPERGVRRRAVLGRAGRRHAGARGLPFAGPVAGIDRGGGRCGARHGLPVGGELDLFARALADLRTVEPSKHCRPQPRASPRTHTPRNSPSVDDDDDDAERRPDPRARPPAPKGYAPAVLAITGTNGKTTVTALTGQLVERAGKTVAVAGNIGPTLARHAGRAHRRRARCPRSGCWSCRASSSTACRASSRPPPRCSTSRRTTSTGTATWPPTPRPRRASSARRARWCSTATTPRVMAMLPAPVRVKLQAAAGRARTSTFGADDAAAPGRLRPRARQRHGLAGARAGSRRDAEAQARRRGRRGRDPPPAPDAGRRAAHPRPPQRAQRAGRAGARHARPAARSRRCCTACASTAASRTASSRSRSSTRSSTSTTARAPTSARRSRR